MNGTAKPGRPRGSGYDDSAVLKEIESYMAEHPEVSARAAISACLDRSVASFDADLRRLQRKLAMKDSGPDARDLLAQSFEHGAPRESAMWSCYVEVPVASAEGTYGVTHSVVVGRPVMLVVRNDEPVKAADQPEHPLFRAVEALPVRHDFDHPDYRLICEALGIDPDRGRPPYIEAYEDAVDLLRDSFGKRKLSEREQAQIGAALGLFDGARFRPGALRRVLELEDNSERARRIQEQAAAIMKGADWRGSEDCALLRMLATPWSYEHESILDIGGPRPGELPPHSVIDMPLFLAPPNRNDPAERMLCLLYERNLCAVTLSPEEWKNWQSGGDMAHWLRTTDARTPLLAKLRPAECDLSMTLALRQAMIETAYDGYLARTNREPFDPTGPLGYERSGRAILPSRPPSPGAVAREVLGAVFSGIGGVGGAFRRGRKTVGKLVRVFGGELIVTVYTDGQASFRGGRFAPWAEDRPIDVSVTFSGARHGVQGVPLIHRRDFRLTFADGSQECLSKETALLLLERLASIAASLPVPDYGEAIFYAPVWRGVRSTFANTSTKIFIQTEPEEPISSGQ